MLDRHGCNQCDNHYLMIIFRHKLIRAEQNEIIDFAKSCLPVFLKQIQAFLNSFKVMANSSSMRSRLELASHVIPEVIL